MEVARRWRSTGGAERRDAVCKGKGIDGREDMRRRRREKWDPEHGGREAGLQLPIYHIELLFGSVEAII